MIAVLAAGVVAFLVLRPHGYVTVTVANESEHRLRWVTIEHKRGGERLDDLAPRMHRTVRFRSPGKSDLTVRARFDDDHEVALPRAYSEAGYRFRFAVRDTGIDVQVHP